MSDIIHLLPDSVANQIAAGEVIQRPASVIKELVENSIDAGAKNIQVLIKDGGSTLIQIVDDGVGMSETDARMSFERHATSKIKDAADLFTLRTMGFRGEALASIAAVAQVELRTRKETEELGTLIEIAGTRVFRQESVQCNKGTNIAVKSLFFNVPARRRFLKSPSTEMTHIRNEFYRIVLVHPDISFSLYDGTLELMSLPATSLKARIEHVFNGVSKKKLEQQLLPIETNTSILSVTGFVGRPEYAQKLANQYFFVNGRYMRHPYFHKAVMVAYNQLIKPNENPNYFIYFDIDTQSIDVNVHPSKTEIKFENEQAIWSILLASVKEALGKFQVMPPLDFDQDDSPEIPVLDSHTAIRPPGTHFDPSYNPFRLSSQPKRQQLDWEQLYGEFKKEIYQPEQQSVQPEADDHFETRLEPEQPMLDLAVNSMEFYQFKNKYILTTVKSGLMIIDQHRAHKRVLFDRFMKKTESQKGITQQVLFPEILELSKDEFGVMEQILPDLSWVGFDIVPIGKSEYAINGIPSEIEMTSTLQLLKDMIATVSETEITVKESIKEEIAIQITRHTAIQYGQTLNLTEMRELFDNLFTCENHMYTPDGKLILSMIQTEDIENKFK
ncbi:MAG TPA: DNA mismatch repair endonuclease MutL [Paludibacteraceae bacterium]|nr:DNA mismatch repair endonuclease MutL [Paludibacteraceae bacterium]HPT43136.1 DNA mismatch repair endonuclease MutL [Paludibacteraceae bacterium]